MMRARRRCFYFGRLFGIIHPDARAAAQNLHRPGGHRNIRGDTMEYQLLTLDIDGTLRPDALPCVPRKNVTAVRAVQKAGVKVAIATGRCRGGISKQLLGGIRPDYWICAAGAEVLDGAGNVLHTGTMTDQQMYALVDFFENYDCFLGFNFDDGPYGYVNCARELEEEAARGMAGYIHDGEDQVRHLESMPYSAFGRMPQPLAAQFQEKYGYLGLRFLYYGNSEGCDILTAEQDKARGLETVCAAMGIDPAQAVSVGDGSNDCGILKRAGLGVCMTGGDPRAARAADRLCPPAAEFGVAQLCKELWPEAF